MPSKLAIDASGGNAGTASGVRAPSCSSGPDIDLRRPRSSTTREATAQSTALPGLGSGIAQAGSSGITLVTDKTSIPAYFVGHWVEVSSPDGTLKGTWKVTAISGSTLTLEDGATVDEGDSWTGFYRFDTLTVQGKAKLILGDADDIGTITVAADSTLQHLNRWAPAIDPTKVAITVASGAYWVTGSLGAVTDVDGISAGTVTNLASSQSWPLGIAADGSFPAVQVTGIGGNQVEIEATDAGSPHRTTQVIVGSLPANPDVPAIDGGLITYSVAMGGQYRLIGAAGAVTDSDPPLTVTATNDATLVSFSTVAGGDGSFDMAIAGTPGDSFTVSVTDSHPTPATGTLQLGPMPDLADPTINAQAVTTTVHDRSFWIAGAAGAVTDDGDLATVEIVDPQTVIAVASDGSFTETAVAAPTGSQLTLRATDSAGNSAQVLLPGLPANDGPPTIDTVLVWTNNGYFVDGGMCHIHDRAEDDAHVQTAGRPCFWPFSSPDGLSVTIEDRTTPGFGPWTAPIEVKSDGLQYWFDATPISGAIGDEIWVVAEDGHPDPLMAEARVKLFTPPGSPTWRRCPRSRMPRSSRSARPTSYWAAPSTT